MYRTSVLASLLGYCRAPGDAVLQCASVLMVFFFFCVGGYDDTGTVFVLVVGLLVALVLMLVSEVSVAV